MFDFDRNFSRAVSRWADAYVEAENADNVQRVHFQLKSRHQLYSPMFLYL